MPIYEFRCKGCKKIFEEFVRSKDYKINCPYCNSQDVDKLISTVSQTGNGSGGGGGGSCSSCSGTNCSSCH